jgi:hypothetical protein
MRVISQKCARCLVILGVVCYLAIATGTVVMGMVPVDYDYPGHCNTPYDTVQHNDYTISFCGREYNAEDNESTWYYCVTAGATVRHAVSHWTLALCPEHVIADADPGEYETGRDPTLDIPNGIKWEDGVGKGQTKCYSVTLEKNWEVDYVEVGFKAGQINYTAFILGPSCVVVVPPQLEVTVEGLKNLTVDQPTIGQWAMTGDLTALIGDPNDGTGLTVAVAATDPYDIYVSYSYSMSPAGSLPSPEEPLLFEYPTGSGTWYTIPKYPSMAELYGLSGTSTYSYPVAVDLTQLGERTAGDSITFTIHVMVTQ